MNDFLTRLATRAIGFSHELAPPAQGMFVDSQSPDAPPAPPTVSPGDKVRSAVATADIDTLRRAPTPKVQVASSRRQITALADAPIAAPPEATVGEPHTDRPTSPMSSHTHAAVPVGRDVDATSEFAVAPPEVVREEAPTTAPSGLAAAIPHVATHEVPLRSARAGSPSATPDHAPLTVMASPTMAAMIPLAEVPASPGVDNTVGAAAPEKVRAANVQEGHPAPTPDRADTTRKPEAERDVRVSIGTIHIKARNAPVPSPRMPNAPAAPPRLSLDDYLSRRNARTR